ncbi:hypothetical protein [Loigolactobacillus binensis]|uniref:Transposase n=1 Tax=Loigolactobacillus binensis TaxID=2559922 RepID=A0ABW3EEF4_9LACO|nr:hypothetical protein [Loigolactobacillus binensis]
MKLCTVQRRLGFQKNTFYAWLQEQQIIQQTSMGEALGVKALPGMKTEIREYVKENDEIGFKTWVDLDEQAQAEMTQRCDCLILPKRHTSRRRVKKYQCASPNSRTTDSKQLKQYIKVLENQILKLNAQLACYKERDARRNDT